MSGLPSSGSSPYQGPANSLSELKARAVVPKEDAGRYAAKAWIGLATKLYQQNRDFLNSGSDYLFRVSNGKRCELGPERVETMVGFSGDASYEANDLESAYVSYLKGCSIVVEIIPKALELNKNDPVYIDLRKSTVNRYLSVVEKIAETLESQFKSRNRDIANPNRLPIDARANEAGRSNNISSSPHSQLEDRLNALQSLPNVPTTLPSANSMKMPIQSSTTLPPSSQFRHNTPPPIPSSSTKPQWVAGAPPPPPTSTKPTSWRASHSHHIPSPVPSPSQSKNAGSPTPSNSSYWSTSKLNISLPTQTSNTFPRNLDITPEQLVKYLTQKQNPPSILLMDVRPREEFENGCIRHKYIIQIEPLTLRQGYVHTHFSSSILKKQ
ncbi:hypothetical protein BC937DRAFT_92173 [Endogone sp. FLAS-F59071]|nr:hypothetical protein BC937DRAFT_92173 [Endogone sp. FLAS-F59071]|eukprot:RUS15657.1 hypothetical protein BC937DRAFT_92173 [Endogone sp. FLAS-F59071]